MTDWLTFCAGSANCDLPAECRPTHYIGVDDIINFTKQKHTQIITCLAIICGLLIVGINNAEGGGGGSYIM